jgi:hypothetical protein
LAIPIPFPEQIDKAKIVEAEGESRAAGNARDWL